MNYRLQILHASDFEAGLRAVERAGNFAAIVDFLEDQEANSITLSSGDNYLPSPFFAAGSDPSLKEVYETALEDYYNLAPGTLNYGNPPSVGAADLAILNILGVQASTIGNHEFDAGTATFNTLINQTSSATGLGYLGTQFPYLSANLDFSGDANLNPRFTTQIRNATEFAGVPGSTGAGVPGALPAAAGRKIAPATIIEENGERIGVVGATTQIVESISSTGGVDVIGDDVNDMPQLARILQPTIDALRAQGINKIVLASHLQQLNLEQALAPLLTGVDIIIAGGSHTLLADAEDAARGLQPGDTAAGTYPIVTAGADGKPTLIVNTSSEYSYVGRLVVEFDGNGDVIPASGNPAVSGAFATTDAVVTNLYDVNNDGTRDSDPFASGTRGDLVRDIAAGVGSVIQSQDGNTFGRTSVYLEGRREEVRTEETNLGNLSADANLFVGRQTDAAVTVSIKNGGGIRDSIGSFTATGGTSTEAPPAANLAAGKEAGEVSQLDIANALRFNNSLSLVTVTSAQLLQVLEHAVAAVRPGATPGQFAQIGGIEFSYDPDLPVGNRVQSVALVDEAGNPTRLVVQNSEVVADAPASIRVVTLSFLLTGGDGYPFQTFIRENPAFANVVNLDTGSGADNAAARTGAARFVDNGTEQDALAEYLAARFATTPYGEADVSADRDTRIQNLNLRADAVLERSVTGTNGPDNLTGGPFADRVSALGGDDLVRDSAGNDIYLGGLGTDTLVFAGPSKVLSLTRSGPDFVVRNAAGEIDRFAGFEQVVLDDRPLDLGPGGRPVTELYFDYGAAPGLAPVASTGLPVKTGFAEFIG